MVRKVITHIKYPVLLAVVVFCLLGVAQAVLGSNIDPADKYAWSANAGWVNFNPQCGGCEGVTVYADHLEGYAWGENVGWIRFKGTNPVAYNVVTTFRPPIVGGYTEPLRALLWPWLVLAALVATGAIAAVALKRRAA